jgi:DNA-directed RNA polymerase subunit RPC12/RpoP
MKEYECADCGAVFTVDIIEDSEESPHPEFCPFCGSDDIKSEEDDDDDDDSSYDDDELFEDDED